MSAAQFVERLTSTADDKGPPGRDDAYGYGRIDLAAAFDRRASEPGVASPVYGIGGTPRGFVE